MAVSTGTTDATVIYRAVVVERYTDASWDEYIRAQSRADDGRSTSGPRRRHQ
jgi:hypothetical protein